MQQILPRDSEGRKFQVRFAAEYRAIEEVRGHDPIDSSRLVWVQLDRYTATLSFKNCMRVSERCLRSTADDKSLNIEVAEQQDVRGDAHDNGYLT